MRDRTPALAPVGRDVHCRRPPVRREQWKGAIDEIAIAVIEGDRDSLFRKRSRIQKVNSFAKRKDVASGALKKLEATGESRARNVQLGIPLVLVVQRDAVVAEYQEPPATPAALSNLTRQPNLIGRGERNTLEPGQHVSELSNPRTFTYRRNSALIGS